MCPLPESAEPENAATSPGGKLTDRSVDLIVILNLSLILSSLFQSLLVELLHLILVFGVGSSHASLVAEWITVVVDLVHASIQAIIVEEGISDALSIRIGIYISLSIGLLFLGITTLGGAWRSFL